MSRIILNCQCDGIESEHLLVEVLAVSFVGRGGANYIVMVVDVGERGESGEY